MSETIRSYTGGANLRRRRRPPVVRYVLLFLLLGVFSWMWFVTRDTHEAGELVPLGQQYELFVSDLLGGREAIAGSSLWEIAPESVASPELREALRNDFGIPAWVLNNYTLGPFHISGNNLPSFDDALIVSRITRVGCLLERFRGWSDQIEDDFAGGLRLRHVPSAGIYYAIRGRILLASSSRKTLVRALTLRPDEAVGQEHIEEAATSRRDEIAHARVLCAGWPEAAAYFEAAEARVWLAGKESRLWLAGRMTDEARSRWSALLEHARPGRLLNPAPGAVQLSVNLGLSLPDAASAAAALAGTPNYRLLDTLQSLLPEESRAFAAPVMEDFVSHLGAGFGVTWRGANPLEMIPMPKIALVLQCDPAWAGEWVGSMPAVPDTVQPWESWPRAAEEPDRVYIPAVAGPDFEPTFAPFGAGMLLNSSHPDALQLLADTPEPAWREEEGNLWLRVEPAPLCKDLLDLGRELARAGLLRDLDKEAFDTLAESWSGLAGKVETVQVLAQHEAGVITIDLRLKTME
ncbi:MAG: hypothetical protein GC168_11220 [Candidatus Hydrogenedens sp.]|nr:hypothetical protein [Candidatus Hydrogenedens sp.]